MTVPPKRFAVPIACRPATHAQDHHARGFNVPAAVISIGNEHHVLLSGDVGLRAEHVHAPGRACCAARLPVRSRSRRSG